MVRLNPVSVAVLAGLLVANWCQLVSATPALIMNQIQQLALEQLDPIVNPNAQSSHMHSIFGGSAFGASYSYADSMAGSCTSTYITADKSNYWAPQLYWSPDPNAASPAFYPAQSLLRIYYFVGRQGTQPNSPFPEGLRMIVGSPNDRQANEYIQHSCATSGSDYASSDNFNMNLTCPLGVRTLIYFPPCWDGINLYKSDGSHMEYPVMGYRDGGCPWTHPVKVPAMFYELTWKLPPQASGLPVAGHLVWANGDTTGYGAHADFTNGWDTNVLATILNDTSCTGGSTSNVFDSCASAKPYVNSGAASSCKPDKGQLAEPYPAVPWSPVPVLPGCNPVWNAGVSKPACNPKPAGLDVSRFTGTDGAYQVPASQQQALKWPTTPGWSSIACLASATGVPIFTQSTSFISSSMTVEMCTDSCARGGFKYAALSSAPSIQCMCGAALTDNAPMTSSDQCATPCPGNANQMCGGSYNWALWYTSNPSTALSANSTDSSALGCYSNPSPVATANGLVAASSYSFSSGSMTTATCKAGCLSFNYDWAATMNGGNCYCGSNAKFTLGTGSYVPQSMCNTPCLGNKTEMCGGYNNLDIFNLTTALTPGSTLPATSVPTGKAAGWQSCRNDSPRGMTAAGTTVTPMTPDYCKVSCAEIGYPLAGLSFGNRCYCGNSYTGGGVLPVAQCGTACTGNGNYTCGGSYTLDLYNSSLSSATFPDPVTQHSAGWQGCYANGKVSQDYTFVSQVMTPEVCMSGCAATDYKYAAIYGKYCYCGNTLSTGAKLMSLPNCNTQCAGKASQWCGGYNNQDVYSIASRAYGSGANSTNSTSTGTAPVCYGATSSGATALNGPTFTVSTMTNAVCATGCMELGYKLSGTRAGNTCVCGNAIDATASKQAPTLCATACAGAASEFCGASSYMSISTASALGSAVSKDNGYQGCFAEGASAKALTGYSYTATTMTNSLCKAACAKAGFSLSGTENGNGCFCGNSFGGGAQTATARCNSPCSGNSTQSCGGGTGFLSLWNSTVTAVVAPVTNNSTSNTTTPATGSTGSTGYLGCYTDTNTIATYFYSSGLMSNAICVQQCYAMGYAYSATGNGNYCRCGNTAAKALTQKTNCNTACAGTSSDMCGGGTTAVSVYDVNVAERNIVASGQAQNQTFGAMGSMGCRYNGAKGALLAASSISTGTMTPTQCIQTCGQSGYALAGTVAGSYCWCDNNLQNAQGGGYLLPDSSCNKPCSGDASQMCGATGIINVYNVKASGVNTKTLSAPGYQGCFAAGTFISAAPYTENDGYMTTDTCRVSCNYKGYAYAGITGGRVCYCSATANMGVQLGDVSCSTKCVGDNTQLCGGSSSVLSVYTTKDAIIAKAGQPANYRGCFLNSGNPNVMPNWSLASSSMTPTLCQQNCKTLGYQFAGLEAGNICRCGTVLPTTLYSDAACNSPCTGSSSTTCGGYHADAVYDVTASGTPVAAAAANSTTSSAKPASASATASASSKPASVSASSSSKPASVSATSSKPASVSVSASSSKPASASSSSSRPASVSASSSRPASVSASSSKPASVSASSSKPASVSASSSKPASVSASSSRPASVSASSSKPASVSASSSKPASVSASSSKPASVSASSSRPASVSASSSKPASASSTKPASASSSAPATTHSSTKLASSSSSRPANSTSTVRTASSSLPSQALIVTSSTSAGCAAGSTQVVTKTVTVTAGAAGTPAKRSRGKAWAKRLYRESSESF